MHVQQARPRIALVVVREVVLLDETLMDPTSKRRCSLASSRGVYPSSSAGANP
ncbi:hypothetical protein [Streptomyces mirabilis]|uniref:hypothetical protein n=1 Tax=Streptomyces mirabilis TaxID=68239 RepID=UPI00380DA9C2